MALLGLMFSQFIDVHLIVQLGSEYRLTFIVFTLPVPFGAPKTPSVASVRSKQTIVTVIIVVVSVFWLVMLCFPKFSIES